MVLNEQTAKILSTDKIPNPGKINTTAIEQQFAAIIGDILPEIRFADATDLAEDFTNWAVNQAVQLAIVRVKEYSKKYGEA